MGGLAHFVVSSSPVIYLTREVCSKFERVQEREKRREEKKLLNKLIQN